MKKILGFKDYINESGTTLSILDRVSIVKKDDDFINSLKKRNALSSISDEDVTEIYSKTNKVLSDVRGFYKGDLLVVHLEGFFNSTHIKVYTSNDDYYLVQLSYSFGKLNTNLLLDCSQDDFIEYINYFIERAKKIESINTTNKEIRGEKVDQEENNRLKFELMELLFKEMEKKITPIEKKWLDSNL